MAMSPSAGLPARSSLIVSPAPSGRAPAPQRPAAQLRSKPAAMRNFEISALRKDGTRYMSQVKVPAVPLFDSAFSAFAHGSMFQTSRGEIAIEDIQPGDELATLSGASARVIWIGSGNFEPSHGAPRTELVRVMGDSFGAGRPDRFLTLGPGARILQTPAALRGSGTAQLLTPVREFIDGVNVIGINPPTAVHLYHLVLDRHAVLKVGNLECESFHPGMQTLRSVSHAMRDLFLSMFPHIAHATDFGPLAHPRAPELDSAEVA